MKRLVAFIVSVALTATLSAAPSYHSSVRPLVYNGTGICTVVQVEDWPQYWLGAGHCYLSGIWVEKFPGIQVFEKASPTIDGHRAQPVVVNTDWTDVAVFYTPGYDIVGIDLHHGKLKAGDKVTVPNYRYAKEFTQVSGLVVDTQFSGQFDYDGEPRERKGYKITHDDVPNEKRPTFGSSGSPVLKDGRIIGIFIGGSIDVFGRNEYSVALPLEQLYDAMKRKK